MAPDLSRRTLLKSSVALGMGVIADPSHAREALSGSGGRTPPTAVTNLSVNGQQIAIEADCRVTLLDALRELLDLTGAKKGCDQGQCGACTVLVNGRRINACLTLLAMHEGDEIVTIEGLGTLTSLHPMQEAFLRRDGLQCGYCTPGQICSSVAMLKELQAGIPSHVTENLSQVAYSQEEVRERMSGNICRCCVYPNIVAAINDVNQGDRK
jgi:xanthine dehydrogenase YagT iron-sulfur-binding subunit